MTRATCRLTAKNRNQLRNPTLGNRLWATFLYLVLHVDGHLDEPRQHRLFRADEPPRLGSRHLLQLRGTVVPLAHVAVHLVVGQRRRRLGVLSSHSDDDRPVVGAAL